MKLTDILCTLGNRSTEDGDKLVSVEADLHPVVEQGEQRGQWEGCHEDGHKTVLDHCRRERGA